MSVEATTHSDGRQSSRNRLVWADWARALGACAVVAIHVLVSTRISLVSGGVFPPAREVAYGLIEATLLRWAVPAFMMLTGYLMFDESRPAKMRDMLRRAGRLGIVLVLFGTAFAAMEEAWGDLSTGGVDWLSLVPRSLVDVLTLRSWDHLWYLYATMGTYVTMPFLRRVRVTLGTSRFRILSVAMFSAVLVLPTVASLSVSLSTGVASDAWQWAESGWGQLLRDVAVGVSLACVGGCLRDAWPARGLAVAGALSVAASAVAWVAAWEVGLGGVGADLLMHWSPLPAVAALGVLSALRMACGEDGRTAPRRVSALARDSLGVYVIHPLFVHLALLAVSPEPFPPVVFEVTFFVAVLLCSVAATRLFRRIPHLGHLL